MIGQIFTLRSPRMFITVPQAVQHYFFIGIGNITYLFGREH
jgi:hypothetical protein